MNKKQPKKLRTVRVRFDWPCFIDKSLAAQACDLQISLLHPDWWMDVWCYVSHIRPAHYKPVKKSQTEREIHNAKKSQKCSNFGRIFRGHVALWLRKKNNNFSVPLKVSPGVGLLTVVPGDPRGREPLRHTAHLSIHWALMRYNLRFT